MARSKIRINPAGNPEGFLDLHLDEAIVEPTGGVEQTLADALAGAASDVQQIVAGDNVTLDPVGGQGIVTVSVSGEGGSIVTDLANDPATTTGLTYGWKPGFIETPDAQRGSEIAADTLLLEDDTESNIYVSASLGVFALDSSLPAPVDAYNLAQVATEAGVITDMADRRSFLNPGARLFQSAIADGGFASATGLDLTFSESGSLLLFLEGRVNIQNTTVTLNDDVQNFVEINSAGVIVAVTGGFSVGSFPLCIVTTAAGVIDFGTFSDSRPFGSVPSNPPVGQFIATGGAAGNIVCTGIALDDRLDSVLRFTAGALVSVLTSEFTISDADEINNTGGTDTTGSTLLVTWSDRTP